MTDKNKNYIDVLESFKKEKEQQLKADKEAKAKQAAIDTARRDQAMYPAVELFEQLFERYKNALAGPILYRESATSLKFKVHGGVREAAIDYGCLLSVNGAVQVGLRLGFKADAAGGKSPTYVKVVPENEVHNLFPALLSGLAEMEIRYPQWAPKETAGEEGFLAQTS